MFSKKRTYETITAGLRSLVDELKAHGDDHHAAADAHLAKVDEHVLQARLAKNEAERAHKTAAKVAALLASADVAMTAPPAPYLPPEAIYQALAHLD